MFRVLLKKQLMEINARMFRGGRSKKPRSAAGMIAVALVWAVVFVGLGSAFYAVGSMLCEPLVGAGLGWMYISLMGLIAIALGVFGSVFSTYTTLYKARDNELLLSMPIPTSMILDVRLIGVWMWSLIYEAVVFVPALIVYWTTLNGINVPVILSGIWLMLTLSVLILTLSAVLGWVVAKIGNRLKGKSFVAVLASLAFFALYYWGYFHAVSALNGILENAAQIGESIKGAAAPLYIMGRAGEGGSAPLLLVTAVIFVIFAAVRAAMSRSFLKDASGGSAAKKKHFKEPSAKAKSVSSALFSKELRRFTSSANYMLNCGFGTMVMPALGVLAVINAQKLREFISPNIIAPEAVAPIICAVLCMVSCMNDITAPSVSLEGKNIWILQSMPVPAWLILKAKLKLHLIVTEIPALFCAVCLVIAVRLEPVPAVLTVLVPALFVTLSAAFGLAVNLKSPNLEWTNENVPIKQSIGVMLSLFGGWIFVIALSALCFALRDVISPTLCLAIYAAFIALLAAALISWLKNKGSEIFETL